MAITLDAFIAQRQLNFNWLIGNHLNITFTILDSSGIAYNFSGYTALTMRIYDKRQSNRNIIDTLSETNGDLSLLTNVITLDTAFPATMTYGQYNYELEYTNASGDLIRLAEGYIYVI